MSVLNRSRQPGDAPVATGNAQRVRWGLTGLAAIFLLVLIAAVSLRPTRAPTGADAAQGESLARLGVAPGAASGEPAPSH